MTQMTIALLFQLTICFALGAALTTTYCGESEIFCLGNEISFQCNTTHPFLEWYLHNFKEELDFSYRDNIGQNESVHGFTAFLTGKERSGKSTNLMSKLVFTLELKYNNTIVTCTDGYTGQNQTCTIAIGKADLPVNVTKCKHNETSLYLSWSPPIFTGGVGIPVENYVVTVSPPPSIGPCRSEYCTVNNTNITLYGLNNCSGFNITITPKHCNGLGSRVMLSVISKVPGKVLNPNENEPQSLNWTMPMDNGGENILHYLVCDTANCVCQDTSNHSIAFKNLTDGEYNFSVRAVNCHGPGDPVFISVTVNKHLIEIVAISVPAAVLVIFLFFILVLLIFAAVGFHRKYRRQNYHPMNEGQNDFDSSLTI